MRDISLLMTSPCFFNWPFKRATACPHWHAHRSSAVDSNASSLLSAAEDGVRSVDPTSLSSSNRKESPWRICKRTGTNAILSRKVDKQYRRPCDQLYVKTPCTFPSMSFARYIDHDLLIVQSSSPIWATFPKRMIFQKPNWRWFFPTFGFVCLFC